MVSPARLQSIDDTTPGGHESAGVETLYFSGKNSNFLRPLPILPVILQL